MRLSIVILICSMLVSFRADFSSKEDSDQYISNYENVLGTSLELRISAQTEQDAQCAEVAALAEIERISKILSAYDASSEFSVWLRTKDSPVPISKELYEVLDLFDQWRDRTHGALDASAEVISRVWKKASLEQRTPTQQELQDVVSQVTQTHWKLDPTTHTATHVDDAPLILNSFAKSYIINKAADAAIKSGNIDAVVVNIGGDIVVRGHRIEPVLVSDPRADAENDEPLEYLKISNRAIATSGNYRRGVRIGDEWYSHIVDPRSGQPADGIISATVIASDPTDAGALATAFSVLNPIEAKQLASTIHDIEYLLITKEGERIESLGFESFKDDEIKKPDEPKSTIQNHTASAWDPEFELVVDFELSRMSIGWYKRPYVAVWIEDMEKKPIKNLALWYGNIRWLSELHQWYRTNWTHANAKGSKVSSVTSATRPAGKYTLKWDGTDDDGNLVEPGKYVFFIESARELGTHQIIRQEIEFTGVPKKIEITGNEEIASASLDYRKKQ